MTHIHSNSFTVKKSSYFILLAILLCLFCSELQAQTEERKKPVRAVTTTDMPTVSDNIELDLRARKHYTTEDIRVMPTLKKKQVNFMYTQSYLPDPKNSYNTDCSKIPVDEFDVYDYNKQRKEKERVTIVVADKTCKFLVVLLSWDEVKQQNKKIESEQ